VYEAPGGGDEPVPDRAVRAASGRRVEAGTVWRVRRLVSAVGRILFTSGLLILAFVAYQLWGTGIYEARQQSDLKAGFHKELAAAQRSAAKTPSATPSTPPPTAPAPPPPGDAVAIIRIPKIGVDHAVVEGVGRPDLRKGPGHYPDTPMPGQLGNAAIAGHRTTYGAPFNRLDELDPGDEISVTTVAGDYRYRVQDLQVVRPGDVAVLDAHPDPQHPGQVLPTLTLTTCNPKYSAAQRLVATAVLDAPKSPPPAAAPVVTKPVVHLDAPGPSWGTGHDRALLAGWGALLAVAGFAWWWLFHRHKSWRTWAVGAIPFVVVLFFFDAHLERMLPGNF